MTNCPCSFVYADTARVLRGRPGCPHCGGRGVVPTFLTPEDVSTLESEGWTKLGEDKYQPKDGGACATAETALFLARSEAKRSKAKADLLAVAQHLAESISRGGHRAEWRDGFRPEVHASGDEPEIVRIARRCLMKDQRVSSVELHVNGTIVVVDWP